MFDDLRGKRALITGASSGLGRHFAQLLARHGVAVTLAARRLEALEEVRDSLQGAGGAVETVRLDVADTGSIDALFAEADPFDLVVNNAGVSNAGAALDLPAESWDQTLDINLRGPFLVGQAAARALKGAGRGGAIVNVASIVGFRPAGSLSAYAASKAGLIQLTRALALEWARHDIRVNALCPGYFETDINREFFATPAGEAMVKRIPQRRLGRMEDLDAPLLLLCSEAGAYITGTALTVDGGHLVSSL